MTEREWDKKLIEGAKKNVKKFRTKIAQLQKELRRLTDDYWGLYNKSLELEDEISKEKNKSKRLENKIETQNAIISDLIKIIEEERISVKLNKKNRASIVATNTNPKPQKEETESKKESNNEVKSEVKESDSELRKLIKQAIKNNIDTYA